MAKIRKMGVVDKNGKIDAYFIFSIPFSPEEYKVLDTIPLDILKKFGINTGLVKFERADRKGNSKQARKEFEQARKAGFLPPTEQGDLDLDE